jgi:hypothetical protein
MPGKVHAGQTCGEAGSHVNILGIMSTSSRAESEGQLPEGWVREGQLIGPARLVYKTRAREGTSLKRPDGLRPWEEKLWEDAGGLPPYQSLGVGLGVLGVLAVPLCLLVLLGLLGIGAKVLVAIATALARAW